MNLLFLGMESNTMLTVFDIRYRSKVLLWRLRFLININFFAYIIVHIGYFKLTETALSLVM